MPPSSEQNEKYGAVLNEATPGGGRKHPLFLGGIFLNSSPSSTARERKIKYMYIHIYIYMHIYDDLKFHATLAAKKKNWRYDKEFSVC